MQNHPNRRNADPLPQDTCMESGWSMAAPAAGIRIRTPDFEVGSFFDRGSGHRDQDLCTPRRHGPRSISDWEGRYIEPVGFETQVPYSLFPQDAPEPFDRISP